MHKTKYLWGTLVLVLALVFFSPFPANAQSPDNKPAIVKESVPPKSSKSKTYTFAQVWTLINNAQRVRPSHFSPELVACLMWEESGFRLVENPSSHALGFGQIMPSTLNAINRRFKTNFTRTQVLTSPEASVEATVLALEIAYEWKGNKFQALVAYAGGERNYSAVRKWLMGEPRMIQARWADASNVSMLRPNASAQIITALRYCSQAGFDPQHTF